jgi:hypothetical protein
VNRWPLIRDVGLFAVGMIAFVNEAILQSHPEPSLLLIYAGLMGAPAVLRSDERKGNGDGGR